MTTHITTIEQYEHQQNCEHLLVEIELYVDFDSDGEFVGSTVMSAKATNDYGNQVVLENFNLDWDDLSDAQKITILDEVRNCG